MVTKDIMAQVDKTKAQAFMNSFKASYNNFRATKGFAMGDDFTRLVCSSLNSIGLVDIKITSGTANAVVEKMEKKSGIKF